MTDSGQTIVNKYSYDPFGKITANSIENVSQPFKFVGQFGVMSEPNGFYYMRARYYDPEVGRFISEDPIGFGGGDVNLMAYVGNQPINYVDPEGLKLWYADSQSDTNMRPAVKVMMQSSEGRKLLKMLHDAPETYYIHGNSGSYGPAYQQGNDVYVNPSFHPTINTTAGTKAASTPRILAHELGHLTGTGDTGPGRMNNINTWENPIMSPIEGYSRTSYGSGSGNYGK